MIYTSLFKKDLSMASHTDHPSGPLQFIKGFVNHPASVNETYWQHARFAFGFSVSLFLAAGAALIHAIVPPLFETTASRIICALHTRLAARH